MEQGAILAVAGCSRATVHFSDACTGAPVAQMRPGWPNIWDMAAAGAAGVFLACGDNDTAQRGAVVHVAGPEDSCGTCLHTLDVGNDPFTVAYCDVVEDRLVLTAGTEQGTQISRLARTE